MSGVNIIIDGNYLFHRSLPIYQSEDALAGLPKLTSENDKSIFARKVLTDICYTIRKVASNKINKVIFTIDGRSWRKDVKIEENEGYKSNRKKGSEINWEGFYEVMDEVGSILSKRNVYVSRVKKAEGDDLMYLYAKKFIEAGENTIVVTGDKDIWQIVDNRDGNFTVIYMPDTRRNTLVMDKETKRILDEHNQPKHSVDTEFSPYDTLIEITDKHEVVDPVYHAFVKVFTGDGGDAVPCLFTWETKTKTGKTMVNKLTENRVSRIWKEVDRKTHSGKTSWSVIFDLKKHSKYIKSVISDVSKGANENDTIVELTQRMERNIQLMILHTKCIPEEVISNFETDYERVTSKMMFMFKNFYAKDFYPRDLLMGSKYEVQLKDVVDASFNRMKANVKFDKDDYFFDDSDTVKLV